MSAGGDDAPAAPQRTLRPRACKPELPVEAQVAGNRAMRAALAYLDATYDSPSAAAHHFQVERQHVNYYIRKLSNQGMSRSEKSYSNASSTPQSTISSSEDKSSRCWDKYVEAWTFAAELCKTKGRIAASIEASAKFGVRISPSSARRAYLAGGEPPAKPGKRLAIPANVEYKLEDLCLCLREMNIPVFRYMVLNYVNELVKGTHAAESLKDKEVKRHWYYHWLGRCKRLKTANLTPLEMSRAQWATSKNAEKHYDMLADILVKLGIAVPNESFDPKKPRDVRLHIVKPDRIFSMDETRLTNDTTDKNKSKKNRSLVGQKGDTREVLANKGGGDGTGIGGSAANGLDLPGFFIFAKNIIHSDDVLEKNIPKCRRTDPANPGKVLQCKFWCNEKGGVTGDLGVRYIRGCIEPCLPDLSVDCPAVLIMDGHGSHFTLDLLEYCRKIGLHVVLRPPHTTHILQGEDVVHFRVFKELYHQAKMVTLSSKVLKGMYRLTAADLLAVAREPWETAFNQENCLKAWGSIGVVPFTQSVLWDLRELEARREQVAKANDLSPEMLTVQGMIRILFPAATAAGDGEEDNQVDGRRKRKKTLHSSDLWDLPGGATADDCYAIVKQKTDEARKKAETAKQNKKARHDKRQNKNASLIELGSAIAKLLTAEQQIDRLKVAQLQAILTFRSIVPKGKKDELAAAVKAALKLPQINPMPLMPNLPTLVEATTTAGDAPAEAGGAAGPGAAEVEDDDETDSESEEDVESDEF